MRQAPITSYLGPALVLYLVADVASGRGSLGAVGGAMAATAVLLSLAPLLLSRDVAIRGALRLAWLGVGAGLSLVRYVDPAQMSLTADLSRAVGLTIVGTLVVELALSVPDRVVLTTSRWTRRIPLLVGMLTMAWLCASLLPPLVVPLPSPVWVIVPPVHRWGGEAYLALCLQLALAARLSRRALKSSPEALASNAWGTLCLVPSAAAAVAVAVLVLAGRPLSPMHVGYALAVVSGLLVLGHGRLIQADHRLQAGATARSVVALGLTLGFLCALAAMLLPYVPRNRLAFGFAMAATLFGGLSLHRLLVPVTDIVLAPFRGILLRALETNTPQLGGARHMDELARQVLQTLREAAGDVSAEPRMYFFDPAIEARIDAAGQAHLDNRPMNEAISQRLVDSPGALIMRGPLERLMVREPTQRSLIEGLVHLDAMCVIPLVLERELEGALVLPRGDRRGALTLEETEALRDFAGRVTAQVTILLSEARAQGRAGRAHRASQKAEERLEVLSDEVRRLRADAMVLRAGRAAHQLHVTPIAYSDAMRRMIERLQAVAIADAPVLIEAEGGTPVQALAYQLHTASGRGGETFVIGDCAAVPHGNGGSALFGGQADGEAPGWLRLAAGGTLVLIDVPALSRDVQFALSEAIATRAARPDGGGQPYTVSARVVACARQSIEVLASVDRFDSDLAQRLLPCRLVAPPLRERKADLESLLLLAIDRACRLHGRQPVGLEADVRAVLLGYAWPGNQGELQSVVERAVAACEGRRIRLVDLPETFGPGRAAADDPLTGTLESIERLALRRALLNAEGNKSEAARLLGLKRTTFLDKLRRYDLDDAGRQRSSTAN